MLLRDRIKQEVYYFNTNILKLIIATIPISIGLLFIGIPSYYQVNLQDFLSACNLMLEKDPVTIVSLIIGVYLMFLSLLTLGYSLYCFLKKKPGGDVAILYLGYLLLISYLFIEKLYTTVLGNPMLLAHYVVTIVALTLVPVVLLKGYIFYTKRWSSLTQ
ncbi:MAG: hypothetical protein FH758_04050 [Firmicutes bacterium]|nr:hypothetical protein [Bacillota bacterium]